MTYNLTSLSVSQVWGAFDKLAAQHKMSLYKLASRAGLHSSALRNSVRENRYPNLRTVIMVCESVNMSLVDFAKLVEDIKG